MKRSITKFINRVNSFKLDQRGITGLETAIVLIAFVVVSSVFAFAVLSTGLFASDKAKDTINAGLGEVSGTMELRSSVIATSVATGSAVDNATVDGITFTVANAAGGDPIDLTIGETVITYSDAFQTKTFDSGTEFTLAKIGNADADAMLEPGEKIEITISGLATDSDPNELTAKPLGPKTEFTLEVKPSKGAVLLIQRTTPAYLEAKTNLY